jgi:hypothetical protein
MQSLNSGLPGSASSGKFESAYSACLAEPAYIPLAILFSRLNVKNYADFST